MGNYIKLKKLVTDFYEKAALTILQILFITMWFKSSSDDFANSFYYYVVQFTFRKDAH